jgi:hypothetical protein
MNPSGHQNPPLISFFAGNFKGVEESLHPKIDEISTLKMCWPVKMAKRCKLGNLFIDKKA